MRVLRYVIPPEADGMTVKEFARHRLGFSARLLTGQKQAPDGIVKNGVPCRVTELLRPGDALSFTLPEEEGNYPAVPLPLPILWETEDYLAADKPWNMPVHPSPGHDDDSLLNAAAYHCRQMGETGRFRPLYRLDKDTSGVMLLAKNKAAALAKTEKLYLAVCEGELTGSGTVDLPIGLKEGSRIQRECGHGDDAITHWRAVRSDGDHTALLLSLETGRTHQIRVHMAGVGHPLAGDDLYGGGLDTIKRQALHCFFVRLTCRPLALTKEITAELPKDMRAAFPWLPTTEEIIREEFSCQQE